MEKDLEYIKERIEIEKIKDKTVLLIGSNGFLGNWFSDLFDYTGITYTKYDITDGKDICNEITLPRHDYVINCAGIASPEKYVKMPVETLDVSYIGTRNVLEYCKKHKVESLLMFSSSEVYGTPDPHAIPTKEEYIGTIPTMSSRSCYDIGKQVLETLSYIYYNKHGVNLKIIRPFNVYGPHMGLSDNRVLSNWFSAYIHGVPIKVYGDGKQTRTFCYASDAIAMMMGVLLNGRNGEVYNVGNPQPEINMTDFAKLFCENVGGEYIQETYPNKYPSDEPIRRCPNIDKVKKTTNIEPIVDLKLGLKKMKEFYI